MRKSSAKPPLPNGGKWITTAPASKEEGSSGSPLKATALGSIFADALKSSFEGIMDSMNTGLLTLQICLPHILTATETNPRVMIVIQSCLKTTVNHPLEKAREKKKKAEYDGKERESPYIYMLTKTLQLTEQLGLAIKYLVSDSTLFCRYCFSLYTRSGFEFTSDACR